MGIFFSFFVIRYFDFILFSRKLPYLGIHFNFVKSKNLSEEKSGLDGGHVDSLGIGMVYMMVYIRHKECYFAEDLCNPRII